MRGSDAPVTTPRADRVRSGGNRQVLEASAAAESAVSCLNFVENHVLNLCSSYALRTPWTNTSGRSAAPPRTGSHTGGASTNVYAISESIVANPQKQPRQSH